MGAKKLSAYSGTDKAAVLLLALGEDLAAEIMRQMAPGEIKRLGGALSRLGRIDQETADAILVEFHDLIAGGAPLALVGDASAARRLVAKAAGDGVADALGLATPELVDTLAQFEPSHLGRYLAKELPQTVAVILAHLDAKKAGETLKAQPADGHAELILRVARLDAVDPEVLAEIDAALKQELQRQGNQRQLAVGGVDAVAAMLATMDRTTGERYLDDLEDRDPELAAAVRAQMFRFQDLTKLDDRGMQELLKQVDQKTLRLALKSASADIMQLVVKNMSQRASKMLQDDLAAMPKVRVSDVETAQRQIADLARKLIDDGKIELKDPNDVYV
jgi:flagellar motor switch protein FliG